MAMSSFSFSAQPSRYVNFDNKFQANYSSISFKGNNLKQSENYYFSNKTNIAIIPMQGFFFECGYSFMGSPLEKIESCQIFDASVRFVKKRYELSLRCDNLFNQHSYTQELFSALTQYTKLQLLRPRQFMIKVEFQI